MHIPAPLNIAILLFPDVEVLDFAGPFEVFSVAARLHARTHGAAPFTVFTVSADGGMVRARHGLQVQAEASFGQHPAIDILIVPGGVVTQPLADPATLAWVVEQSAAAQITASVCTGAFILAAAGLVGSLPVTTHWEDIGDLRRSFPGITVLEEVPWVDNGKLVSSAGISAGIGMSLHLVERLLGQPAAIATARQMQYDWQP
jgi:transcriptional regulator GlxA family with amidase domain